MKLTLNTRQLAGRTTLLLGGLLFSLASNAADKIPKLNGHPDFSGIWQTTSAADYDLEPHALRADAPPSAGIVEGNVIPYLTQGLGAKEKEFRKSLNG